MDKGGVIKKQGDQSTHYFTEEERQIYSEHFNWYFKDDKDVKDLIPINPDSAELFTKVGDGILLCKLINLANPGTIDPRAIIVKKPLNIF